MNVIFVAFSLAIATPTAAQPAAQPTDHKQHQQHGQAGHAQHGQQGPGQPGQPGQRREGQRDDCPCCRPGTDGQRPACCERMHQQGQQSH